MPPAPFDPCKQWLGIDAVDLVDPRRVLGIAPLESDPQRVLQAAEARLAILRGVAPGPFARARDALVQRVEEARSTVLAQLSAARTMPAPAPGLSMPPPPGGTAPRPAAAGIPAPVVPRVPTVPQVPRPAPAAAESAWPADQADDSAGAPPIAIRPRVTYRKQSSGAGVLLVLIAGLAAAAGGLYWYKVRPDRSAGKRPPGAAARAEAPAPQAEPRPPAKKERPPERFGVSDRLVSNDRPPDPQRQMRAAPPPTPSPPPEEPPEPRVPEPAKPDPVAEEPAEDRARVEALLRDVYSAIRASEFKAAEAAAGKAAGAATVKSSRQRVERWTDLVTFAKGFAEYRDQALAAVKAGNEYDVDGKKVGIVEVDAEKFVYRFAGKNKTVPRERIPGGIVMAIVTAWFDEKPANDLFVGAYHATKAEPDLDKARAAWERAQSRGADASMLLPLLDDPVLQPPPE